MKVFMYPYDIYTNIYEKNRALVNVIDIIMMFFILFLFVKICNYKSDAFGEILVD